MIKIGDKFGELTVIETYNKNGRGYSKCRCNCGIEIETRNDRLTSGKAVNCGRLHNILNQKFGRLTPIKPYDIHLGKTRWLCQCECGNITYVTTGNLKKGITQSCGCLQKELTSKRFLKNEIGNTYNYLTVIDYAYSKNNMAYWKCKCKCGNEIIVAGIYLRSNNTKSCGCLNSIGEAKIKFILDNNNIEYIKEYKIKDSKYRYDFYLPKYNILIEYDGKQHFDKPNGGWGEEFEKTLKRDQEKNKLAFENNFILIRIPYTHFNSIELEDLLLQSKWRINGN